MSFYLTSGEMALAVPVGVIAAAVISVVGVTRSNKTSRETNRIALDLAERQQTAALDASAHQQRETLDAARKQQELTIQAQRDLAADERFWTVRSQLYVDLIIALDTIRPLFIHWSLAEYTPNQMTEFEVKEKLAAFWQCQFRIHAYSSDEVRAAYENLSKHAQHCWVKLSMENRSKDDDLDHATQKQQRVKGFFGAIRQSEVLIELLRKDLSGRLSTGSLSSDLK